MNCATIDLTHSYANLYAIPSLELIHVIWAAFVGKICTLAPVSLYWLLCTK